MAGCVSVRRTCGPAALHVPVPHVGMPMPAMPACVGLLRDDVNSNAYGVDSSKLARRAAAAGPSVLPLALPVAAPSTAAR